MSLGRQGELPGMELVAEVPERYKLEAELLFIEYFEQCGAQLLNRGHRGTPKSEEHRANIAASLRGMKRGPMSEGHKRKIGRATAIHNKQRQWTPEQRARMADIKRRQWAEGKYDTDEVRAALEHGRQVRNGKV